jgi:hypothetical protein
MSKGITEEKIEAYGKSPMHAAFETAHWVTGKYYYTASAFDAAYDGALDVYQKDAAALEGFIKLEYEDGDSDDPRLNAPYEAALEAYIKALAKIAEEAEPSHLVQQLADMDIVHGKGLIAAVEEVFMRAAEMSAPRPDDFRRMVAIGFERMQQNLKQAEYTCLAGLDVSMAALNLLKAQETALAAEQGGDF